jgi:hypothetical protein
VPTWVKKDNYHGDVVRAKKLGKAGEFGRPGWRVRITKPTPRTIDHASRITASSTRSLEIWATREHLELGTAMEAVRSSKAETLLHYSWRPGLRC